MQPVLLCHQIALSPTASADAPSQCIREWLYPFEAELSRLDSVVSHVPPTASDHQHLPYVGNGHVALVARPDSPLYVRVGPGGRTLNVTVPFRPVVSARLDRAAESPQEAELLQYAGGVVQRFQCYPMQDRSLDTTYKVGGVVCIGVVLGDGIWCVV